MARQIKKVALLLTNSMIMQRYFHEGAVMELVPGCKPVMKLAIESVDAGKCTKENSLALHALSQIYHNIYIGYNYFMLYHL